MRSVNGWAGASTLKIVKLLLREPLNIKELCFKEQKPDIADEDYANGGPISSFREMF